MEQDKSNQTFDQQSPVKRSRTEKADENSVARDMETWKEACAYLWATKPEFMFKNAKTAETNWKSYKDGAWGSPMPPTKWKWRQALGNHQSQSVPETSTVRGLPHPRRWMQGLQSSKITT
jgi:hypothetical protein